MAVVVVVAVAAVQVVSAVLVALYLTHFDLGLKLQGTPPGNTLIHRMVTVHATCAWFKARLKEI